MHILKINKRMLDFWNLKNSYFKIFGPLVTVGGGRYTLRYPGQCTIRLTLHNHW